MMNRLFSRFLLTVTGIVLVGYSYLAWRLGDAPGARWALAAAALLVWSVPMVYWAGGRAAHSRLDEVIHSVAYVAMGWLNFLLVFTVLRDALLVVAWAVPGSGPLTQLLGNWLGPVEVFIAATAALAFGALVALRGPRVREVDIHIPDLAPGLEGFRIAQISDLHVGPIIGKRYVRSVVASANRLTPDLVALTGDIVDGPVDRLAPHVAPLAELQPRGRVMFVMGNHDYYSGPGPWIAKFRALGMRVLLNEHAIVEHGGARLLVGGVTDPAARMSDPAQVPRPDLAAGEGVTADLRLMLAHNPGLTPLVEQAGFDLQLSGHTHAGQFFPWTLAVRMVHAPHVVGLSRRNGLQVYVNPGTGSWGPPVRFGTQTELTLLTLRRGDAAAA